MPQPRPQPKPVTRVVIKPLPKKPKDQGFFEQHYYATLAVIFFSSAFVSKGFGASIRDSIVYGLWLAIFVAFVRTIVRYFRSKANQPQARPLQTSPVQTKPAPTKASPSKPEPGRPRNAKKPAFKPLSPPPGKYPYYGPKKPQT